MVRYRKPTQQTSRIEDRRGSPGMRRGGIALGGGSGLAIILALVVAFCGGGSGLEGLGPILEQLAPPPTQDGGAIAPIGSTMRPSESRIVLTSRGAMRWRSSGTITVGPVTVTIAPNRAAVAHGMSTNQ